MYKLVANSLFGRLLMNLRRFMDTKLMYNSEVDPPKEFQSKVEKHFNSPYFQSCEIFDSTLAAVSLKKKHVKLMQPVHCGFTVLELSKLRMYKMYYSVLKPTFEQGLRLSYMDTDSFILEITYKDFHQKLLSIAHEFDFSKYKRDHPLFEGMSDEEYD